jgi:hypothetical protein
MMKTSPYPPDVLNAIDSIVCSECFPDVSATRLPGPVFEIAVTHTPECGLPSEVMYA